MIVKNPVMGAAASDSKSAVDSLYFLHIPKTAGTSLRHWFHDLLFSQSDLLPCHILEEIDQLEHETINGHRFFSGHFGWQILDSLDCPVPTVTWLRDPVKRSISNYNYNRDNYDELVQIATDNGREEWIGSYDMFRTLPLSELVTDPRYAGYSDNLQTRYLSGIFPSTSSVTIDREILDRAKTNLEKMLFFGICEWMDVSTDAFCHQLSKPQRRLNLQLNRAVNRKEEVRSAAVDAEIMKIEKSESYDRELYQFACDLFRSRFNNFWNLIADTQQPNDVQQILEHYKSENTQTRIKDVLNRTCQQQPSDLPKPLAGTLSFSDPIHHSGWYARSGSKMGVAIRWAGPLNTSAVFFPFDSKYDYEVEFFIRYFANHDLVRTLTVVANDVAVPLECDPIAPKGSLEPQYKIKFKVPAEAIHGNQSYTKVEFKVTGNFVDMGTGDGSKASFATDGFHYRAIDV